MANTKITCKVGQMIALPVDMTIAEFNAFIKTRKGYLISSGDNMIDTAWLQEELAAGNDIDHWRTSQYSTVYYTPINSKLREWDKHYYDNRDVIRRYLVDMMLAISSNQ